MQHPATPRSNPRPAALLAALAAVVAVGSFAAPAAADDFKDGFQSELGRIAAHEVVFVGRSVLAGILTPGRPAWRPADADPVRAQPVAHQRRWDWRRHDYDRRRLYEPHPRSGWRPTRAPESVAHEEDCDEVSHQRGHGHRHADRAPADEVAYETRRYESWERRSEDGYERWERVSTRY